MSSNVEPPATATLLPLLGAPSASSAATGLLVWCLIPSPSLTHCRAACYRQKFDETTDAGEIRVQFPAWAARG